MFRRIEFIHEIPAGREYPSFSYKHGIMSNGDPEIFNKWVNHLKGPRAPRNCRFYFTEQGWKEVGKEIVAACIKLGQRYKVIAIKEKSVDVIAKGPFEVAVRPRKKKNDKTKRNSWKY